MKAKTLKDCSNASLNESPDLNRNNNNNYYDVDYNNTLLFCVGTQ